MADELVEQILVRATQRAYDGWAVEHPSLAAVIDRITLTQRSIEPLRESEQYKQAVESYQRGRNELELLNKLTEIAGPIIQKILST